MNIEQVRAVLAKRYAGKPIKEIKSPRRNGGGELVSLVTVDDAPYSMMIFFSENPSLHGTSSDEVSKIDMMLTTSEGGLAENFDRAVIAKYGAPTVDHMWCNAPSNPYPGLMWKPDCTKANPAMKLERGAVERTLELYDSAIDGYDKAGRSLGPVGNQVDRKPPL